jgi:hypothetical protein
MEENMSAMKDGLMVFDHSELEKVKGGDRSFLSQWWLDFQEQPPFQASIGLEQTFTLASPPVAVLVKLCSMCSS